MAQKLYMAIAYDEDEHGTFSYPLGIYATAKEARERIKDVKTFASDAYPYTSYTYVVYETELGEAIPLEAFAQF